MVRTRPFGLLVGAAFVFGLAATAHGQTSLTWNAGGGGDTNWTTVANWAIGGNPAGAFPNNGQPAAGNTYNATVGFGSPALNANITIQNFTFSGGTIGGGGNLNVNGLFSWSGGTLGGTGTSTLGGNGTFDTSTANLDLDRSVTNTSGSTVTLTGSNTLLSISTNAAWINQAGATFTLAADAGIVVSGGAGTFTNQANATFQKTGGTGTSTVAWNFTNTGTVNATAGTLNFSGNSTQSGAVTVGAGATVEFSNGTGSSTHTWTGTAGSSGLGTVNVAGGSVLFNGSNNNLASNVSLTGGTIDGTGLVTISGPFTWSGGTMGANSSPGVGTTTLAGGASLDASTANLNVNRSITNASGSTVTLTGSNTLLSVSANAAWINQTGATFTFASDASIAVSGGTGSFNNAGTFQKTGGTSTSTVAWNFTNTGTVNATAGTLNFSGNSTQSGAVTVGAGATVEFSNGTGSSTHTWTGTAGSSGLGTVNVAGGSVLFNGSNNNLASNVSLTGGTIDGTGLVTISGPFTWSGGTMGANSSPGVGTTTLAGGASLDASTANLNVNRSITNASGSTVTLTGSDAVLSISTNAGFTNQGGAVFTIGSDAGIVVSGGAGTFMNQANATFQKTGGAGVSSIAWTFTNNGAVNATSGTLNFAGNSTQNGVITVGTGAVVEFSNGTGTSTHTWTGTAGSSGLGTVNIASGSVLFNGTNNNLASNVSLTGGTIDGTGLVTISGPFTWSGGTMGANSSPGVGTTTLAGGASFDASTANLDVNRSVTNASGSTVTLTGSNTLLSVSTNAAFINQTGATFTFASDASIVVSGGAGTFTNAGTFQKTGGTGISSVGWAFTNTGTVVADPGTLSFSSSPNLTNYSGGTLTGGTWRVLAGATLDLGARPITTVAAGTTVEVNGVGSTFADLENHVTVNAGNLNVLGGRSFTPGGLLTNSGILTVGQAAGDGSAFNDGATVTSGGILRGTGTVTPTAGNTVAVNTGGKIMGGQSGAAGVLSLPLPAGQNLALAGTLNVNISGTAVPDANGLSATTSRIALSGGGLMLSGATETLDFAGIGTTGAISNDPNGNGNGFWTNHANYNDAAQDGYVWRVIDFGTGTTGLAPTLTNPIYNTGMFNSFLGTGGPLTLTGGGTAGAVYLSFTPVPEPSSILLVSAAATGMAGWVRRRRARKNATEVE